MYSKSIKLYRETLPFSSIVTVRLSEGRCSWCFSATRNRTFYFTRWIWKVNFSIGFLSHQRLPFLGFKRFQEPKLSPRNGNQETLCNSGPCHERCQCGSWNLQVPLELSWDHGEQCFTSPKNGWMPQLICESQSPTHFNHSIHFWLHEVQSENA
jgi:hypothetical protein